MRLCESNTGGRISAYEILYSPMEQLSRALPGLFAGYFPQGFPEFSGGVHAHLHAIPALQKAKSLGYYYHLLAHPMHRKRVCRLHHLHEKIVFEASGASNDEAILRACALVFLAHRCRKSA